MKAIYDLQAERILGYTETEQPTGTQIIVELHEGFDESQAADAVLVDGVLVIDPALRLARVKALRKARIKQQAAVMITALDWRLQRAEERAALGVEGETPNDVMTEREAIRQASNRAEAEVEALANSDAVLVYSWGVTQADYEWGE